MRKTTKALIAGVAAASALIGASGTASASSADALWLGQTLNIGDDIWGYGSPGTAYQLIMQDDGNLVEYRWDGGSRTRACWASNTFFLSSDDHATYQQDGNFVVYAGSTPLWASDTVGGGGSFVNINSQGALWVGTTRVFRGC
jgi:hypothetical protein